MKRIYRTVQTVLLCFAVCFGLFSQTCLAADMFCSIAVQFPAEFQTAAGYEVKLYHVASYDDNELTLSDKFDYPVEIDIYDGASLTAMAYTLESYVFRDNLEADQIESVDSLGIVRFFGLPQGLYLLTGSRVSYAGHWYEMNPVLLMLPYSQDGSLKFDVVLDAKYETGQIPSDDSDTTVNYHVEKKWKGNVSHPDSVCVELLKDGDVIQSVVLSEDNAWAHWWTGLPDGHDYRVVEKNVPENYTVTIVRDGVRFTVVNQYVEPEPEPTPEPGDTPEPEPTPGPEDTPEPEPTPEPGDTPGPETTPEPTPGLPQSGQDWSLVIGFGFIGLGVLLIGLLSYRRERRDDR